MASQSAMKGMTNGSDLGAAIALRAYYKAEQRGFVPGYELEDWLSAEQEILSGSGEGVAAKPPRKAATKKAPAAKPRTRAKAKTADN